MGKKQAADRQFTRQRSRGRRVRTGIVLLGLLASLASSGVSAEEPPEAPAAQPVAVAPAPVLFSNLPAVAAEELSGARGGQRMVLNLQDMAGQVQGNTIEGTVSTGSATVRGQAFQDLHGVSSVIINSGNNVSIQSSTTVNIVID